MSVATGKSRLGRGLLLIFLALDVSLASCGSSSTQRSSSSVAQDNSTATAAQVPAATGPAPLSPAHAAASRASLMAKIALVRTFGHTPDAAIRKQITALVNRYYTAAAADDGATACSLLSSAMRSSIPATYGKPPGPAWLRGNTCAAVETKMFKLPATLANPGSDTTVTAIHVGKATKGKEEAYVLWRSSKVNPGEIFLEREGSSWVIQ